jgi:hypothetical protein
VIVIGFSIGGLSPPQVNDALKIHLEVADRDDVAGVPLDEFIHTPVLPGPGDAMIPVSATTLL